MPILNYRYRLMPTPAQASVLGRSMATMGWGWNLMVRKTNRALRLIRRGCAGTVQARLSDRVAGKGFVGRRAEKVNKLMLQGMNREDAQKHVRREMCAKVLGYRGSRLAMELALVETEAAKQGQMGSTLGSAFAQVGVKYRNSWEACWKKQRGAPRSRPIREAGWLQAQLQEMPTDSLFRYAGPWGPYNENWVDLGRFFPQRLTKLPDRIKKASLAEREHLKAEFYALSDVRLLQHRPLPDSAILRDMKVTRSTSRPDAEWYLVLAVEVSEQAATKVYPTTGRACGINPARRHALTIVGEDHLRSDLPGLAGEEAGPGRLHAKLGRKIARLQRKLDRQRRANNPHCFDQAGRWIKGQRVAVVSKGMLETEAQLRALHNRIANQRKDTYHKIVDALYHRYDVVYLGEWKPETPRVRRAKKKGRKEAFAKDGTQRGKGEAALDRLGNRMDRENALGLFRQIAKEKAARSAGVKRLVIVPEPYTTMACARCQALTGPKGFGKQGWWTCTSCGHRQLRHRTAAFNILLDGPNAELENPSEAPEPGETPNVSPARGKGAGQAPKGGITPAVGRMPPEGGEGASASGPARRNRKASTLGAPSGAPGLSAPTRAKSSVTSPGGRDTEDGASLTAVPGKAFAPTAETVRVGFRGSQDP